MTVALVHLGRSQAHGEVRRVASWRQIFEAAGASVMDVPLSPRLLPQPDSLGEVVRGRAVPESLTWSTGALMEHLRTISPDVVVVVSARAFDMRIAAGPWTTVLDFVDSLARSYRDRGAVVRGGRQLAFRALARSHARTERILSRRRLRTVAAGCADARHLNAEWVPIVVRDRPDPVSSSPDRDLLFFGTLRYPPNIDALERLGSIWPRVVAARPETSGLVAGADPPARVFELCAAHGWELVPNFASLPEIASRARLAVAPLTRTAGIQIKVLDAAALGLPQLVSPAALDGLAPGFPLQALESVPAWVDAIVAMLADPVAAAAQAATTRAYVEAEYGVAKWADWARQLL